MDMCGICVMCWICVGYVWCEIRQQSSEEPCDETSFGKKSGLKMIANCWPTPEVRIPQSRRSSMTSEASNKNRQLTELKSSFRSNFRTAFTAVTDPNGRAT